MAGPFGRKASTPSKGPSSKTSSVKRDKSITNFFQKTDTPPGATSRQQRITQFVTASRSPSTGRGTPASQGPPNPGKGTGGGLFMEDKKGPIKIEGTAVATGTSERTRSRTPDDIWGDESLFSETEETRYNEKNSSVKRRKVDPSGTPVANGHSEGKKAKVPTKTTNSGPFIDESDSEGDMDEYRELEEIHSLPLNTNHEMPSPTNDEPPEDTADPAQSPLVRDATTYAGDREHASFDDSEGEEFVGEEFRERPWEELELEQPSIEFDDELNGSINDETNGVQCPVCQKALGGLNETQVSIHVNDCLDGKPTSMSPAVSLQPNPIPTIPTPAPVDPNKSMTRMEKAAIDRPAQRDPYSQNTSSARSAFSKMMAGNAEDTAWAAAASSEVSSRGKQAYQRTCPFYKILNGFSITVDAFRYGAVEGCNAYFLSHYHSDHYIGLTRSWSHGPIYCSRPTANLVRQNLRVDPKWLVDIDFETPTEVPNTGGVKVTMITANHCPGSSLFLFEKTIGSGPNVRQERILHCGDFRASPDHIKHPLLCPEPINPVTGKPRQQRIDKCYLDTTYLNPKYTFPSQDQVITACSELCVRFNEEAGVGADMGQTKAGGLMKKFLCTVTGGDRKQEELPSAGGRLLVVIGTYSIGKERICLGIAKALGSKIFATPQKQRICACLEDPELSALLTSDPREAQVHMQTLFEIRADTLSEYLDTLKPAFSRVVGFRPTGWSYRPPASRMLENPPVPIVLRGEHWRTPFTAQDLTPQRGSTRESACFGVPYSEHSSFRELTMFCCALRIGKVIPTVNVGSQKSRDRMKAWMDRWEAEKRRNGLFPASEW
ncbi:DNA cross-link repair protein pso2/snm1 [Penicillium argentinense]|uniref:DNA cross-link repair protein pso2/snm1 n=1 Tax=Penicillium argentinense TaxID=1131581 RepID=A0A9W9ENT5_9EURO|nr:DNA cross-link repair protein pso2/snm1 [Penicillium argentinense]KAJ5085089.1 DNA cross-link repair protein pso2/snm1 [Penicillium argentinense]